jgi:predicted HicB family RNase H-like nuclease
MLNRRSCRERREVTVSLRVTKTEYARIRKTAEKNKLSMPELMERALNQFVEKHL